MFGEDRHKKRGKMELSSQQKFQSTKRKFSSYTFWGFLNKICLCHWKEYIFSKRLKGLLENFAIIHVLLQRNPKQLEGNAERRSIVWESHWVIPVPFLSQSSKLVGSLLVCQPLKQKQQEETLVLWSFLFFQTSCQAMKREEGKQK